MFTVYRGQGDPFVVFKRVTTRRGQTTRGTPGTRRNRLLKLNRLDVSILETIVEHVFNRPTRQRRVTVQPETTTGVVLPDGTFVGRVIGLEPRVPGVTNRSPRVNVLLWVYNVFGLYKTKEGQGRRFPTTVVCYVSCRFCFVVNQMQVVPLSGFHCTGVVTLGRVGTPKYVGLGGYVVVLL